MIARGVMGRGERGVVWDSMADMHKERKETAKTMRDLSYELMGQTTKALTVLSAGASLSMLGFIQALVKESAFEGFKPYAVAALLMFTFSALFATLSHICRLRAVQMFMWGPKRPLLWIRRYWILIGAAVALFVLAVAGIATGIWVAL